MRRSTVCFVALCLTPFAARAQTKPVEFIKAVPDAPAFSFLAATPSKIERPGNLRDLGLAVLNGVADDGRTLQGFAIDASVWNLIPGFDLPLREYQRNPFKYMIGNLQASLATVRASGDSADMVSALGIKAVLLDRGDPMLSDSITTTLAREIGQACRPAQPNAPQSAACVDSVTSAVLGPFNAQRWNATQLAFAAAFGARFDNAEIDNASSAGMDAWLVGAVPFGTRIHLLAQATYKRRTAVDTVPEYSAFNAGARVIAGSPTFTAFVEWAREWRSADDGVPGVLQIDEDVGGWSAGIEMRLIDNTWVSTGIGTQFAALADPDRSVLFINIKWGLSSESRIRKLREPPAPSR